MLNLSFSLNYLKIFFCCRGPVHSISIHPSGRLALSVSKDRTIKQVK